MPHRLSLAQPAQQLFLALMGRCLPAVGRDQSRGNNLGTRRHTYGLPSDPRHVGNPDADIHGQRNNERRTSANAIVAENLNLQWDRTAQSKGISVRFGHGIAGRIDSLVQGEKEVPAEPDANALADQKRRQRDVFVRSLLGHLKHERVCFFYFDKDGCPKGSLHFDGALEYANFDTGLVLRSALLREAPYVMMAHNHPQGEPRPSQEDCSATRRFIEGCRLVGITCTDHLIVAGECVISFRDLGLM